MTLVDRWNRPALDLAEEGSLTQGHALAALSYSDDESASESAARSALAIAERRGDPELRCIALGNIAFWPCSPTTLTGPAP